MMLTQQHKNIPIVSSRLYPDVTNRALWVYFRLNLSFRDAEELMVERGMARWFI